MYFNNELNGQLKGLSKSLEKMKTLTDRTLASLPAEDRKKIEPIQSKMNEAITAIKVGNSDALSDIVKNIDKLKDNASFNK